MMASSSSTSATVAVEKATSDLLIGPDWTMNIDICDSVNSHHWQAKDIIKAVKKRLQHKNPKIQLLALTLLETMVKNCGDFVHFQIAERNILGEMVKTVKKKTDMQVRDKILILLDSWQEAFGGPGGKHSQYYWAYDEIRRSGIQFPPRSFDAAPIFTPPVSHPTLSHNQIGYGMPSNSSRRLDETMATEIETITLSSLEAMRNVMEVLSEMLQAVNPNDRAAVKDEIIVDLIDRCRSNQKKLMQMLTTTGDEELLAQGLELNDSLQSLLAKHDGIASGSPLPMQIANSSPKSSEVSSTPSPPKQSELVGDSSSPKSNVPAPPVVANATSTKSQVDEEEENEDDFALLARRHSKAQTVCNGNPCQELALSEYPEPVKTSSKEQDMIDLLSLALTTTSTSPHTPPSESNTHQVPINGTTQPQQGYPDNNTAQQTYNGNQNPYNNSGYVVPWAQPQPQPQQVQTHQQVWAQAQQYPSAYPPPPWAATPGYANYQNTNQFNNNTNNMFSTLPGGSSSETNVPPMEAARPIQSYNSFLSRRWAATPGYGNYQNANQFNNNTNNMFSTRPGDSSSETNALPMEAARPIQSYNSFPSRVDSSQQHSSGGGSPVSGQKPFIPSYRLFEDLNVLGNASSTSSSLSGASGQRMVGGGRK